jgi:hypothetical protein
MNCEFEEFDISHLYNFFSKQQSEEKISIKDFRKKCKPTIVLSSPSELAMSLVVMVTAKGWPLPSGLPVVMMSGTISCI